jgi:hypothetical protein
MAASSEILIPHHLTARRVCTGAGGGHTRWWREGGAVNSSEDAIDTALCSIYVSTLWWRV